MATIGKRVAELERRSSPSTPGRYHRLIIDKGENIQAAQAAYQTEHGPIGPDDNWTIWEIIDPVDAAGDSFVPGSFGR